MGGLFVGAGFDALIENDEQHNIQLCIQNDATETRTIDRLGSGPGRLLNILGLFKSMEDPYIVDLKVLVE